MYPSDYVYTFGLGIDGTCYNNGLNCTSSKGGNPSASWMYNDIIKTSYPDMIRTITPRVSYSDASLIVLPSDGFVSSGYVNSIFGVVPEAYLKSEIRLGGGDGSADNPYTIAG